MECTVNWTGTSATTLSRSGMTFVAETGSGHTLVMDGAPDADKPENGGANLAPQDVRGCSVKLTSERATTDPKVFTKIHMHFVVTGKALTASAVERAIAMSHDKYCSATIMLGKTAEITTSFDVLDV
jgi:putative redox protein